MQQLKYYILEQLENQSENNVSSVNAFVILKPEFLKYKTELNTMLKNNGWQIIQSKQIKMTKQEAEELYYMHKKQDWYNKLIDYMISDDCIVMICSKDCKDPIKDMKKLKDKFRDAYSKSETKNAMHSSDSLENVKREAKIFKLL